MNKEAIRLLNILKTNEELKKKIEELKFGCMIYNHEFKTEGIVVYDKVYFSDGDEEEVSCIKTIIYDFECGGHLEIIGQATFIDLLFFVRWTDKYDLWKIDDNGWLWIENKKFIRFDLRFEILDQEELNLKFLCDRLSEKFNINL